MAELVVIGMAVKIDHKRMCWREEKGDIKGVIIVLYNNQQAVFDIISRWRISLGFSCISPRNSSSLVLSS